MPCPTLTAHVCGQPYTSADSIFHWFPEARSFFLKRTITQRPECSGRVTNKVSSSTSKLLFYVYTELKPLRTEAKQQTTYPFPLYIAKALLFIAKENQLRHNLLFFSGKSNVHTCNYHLTCDIIETKTLLGQ